MRKLLLLTLLLCGSVLFCAGQTDSDNAKIVPLTNVQSKKNPAAISQQPSTGVNSSTYKNQGDDPSQTKVETNGKYLEYKVDQGTTRSSSDNAVTDEKVMVPIIAEGYTDPNYELNKQRAEDLTKQLQQVPVVVEKTNEELISDLQNKIKAIKDGVIKGCTATTKLSVYEQELQLLLYKK